MNNRRAIIARSCRGPILLITIGVLFAIHQAGSLSFDRTWPFLIIIVGLMRLLERMFTQPMPLPPAPYPSAPNAPYNQPPYTQPPTGGPSQ